MTLLALIEAHAAVVGLGLMVLLLIAFMREWVPPVVVGVAGVGLFLLTGLLPLPQVFAAIANPAPITIGAMFILSAALIRTGAVDAVTERLMALASGRPRLALTSLFAGAAGGSAFLNNTPIVILLAPIVRKLGNAMGLAATRLFIPLSYVAILGGSLTLIGTSTNLLVDGVARSEGLAPFGIFEISGVGLVALISGTLTLLLLGPWLLPDRPNSILAEDSGLLLLSEIEVTAEGPWDGETAGSIPAINRSAARLVGAVRGATMHRDPLADWLLSPGDRLVVRASPAELVGLLNTPGLKVGLRGIGTAGDELIAADAVAANLVEVAIGPGHPTLGRPLAELPLLGRIDVRLVGIERDGNAPGPDLRQVRTRAGDKLLLLAGPQSQRALRANPDLLGLTQSAARPFRRHRAPIAILAFAGAVAAAALGLADIAAAAIVAVAIVLAAGCLEPEEAWGAIDGDVLVLIFAMLAIGAGLQAAGSVTLLVDWLMPWLGRASPLLLLVGVYALTSLLTEIVTNNAVAVLMPPLVIGIAEGLGIEARPLVVAVMFAASASFATPIGYQTNTIVYAAADYRFADFLKIGVPMNVTVGLATCLAIHFLF